MEEKNVVKCIICGKELDKSKYTHKDLCSRECFNIDYWNDKIENFNSQNVVIDGKMYKIGSENGSYGFKGFGGTKIKIKFNDGRVIETTSLWHNGTIPESHRDKLPDNAVFLEVDLAQK